MQEYLQSRHNLGPHFFPLPIPLLFSLFQFVASLPDLLIAMPPKNSPNTQKRLRQVRNKRYRLKQKSKALASMQAPELVQRDREATGITSLAIYLKSIILIWM